MNEDITASCMIDTSLFLDAHQWWWREKAGVRLGVVLMLVVLALCIAHVNGWVIESLGVLAVTIVGVSAGGFALASFLHRQRLVRAIRQRPTYGALACWKFTDEGYEANVGPSRSFTVWEHVLRTGSTPDGAYIYPSPELYTWIPRTAFANEADFTCLTELLAARTKHSKHG